MNAGAALNGAQLKAARYGLAGINLPVDVPADRAFRHVSAGYYFDFVCV